MLWVLGACASNHASLPPPSAGPTEPAVEAPAEPPPYDTSLGWPTPECRARAEVLLAGLTLREKIGQMVQPDRKQLERVQDVAAFSLGSLLSSGGSTPEPNTVAAWTEMIGAFQDQAMRTRARIPLLYGVDAVHGHNSLLGATVFPHNIGLGATRDAYLVRRIARATAEEVAASQVAWTFAPVVAVARDERWGRTYESFGESPEIAEVLGPAAIMGFQGIVPGRPDPPLLATAKHFVGDGGTVGGQDRGDTVVTDAELRRIHLAPFVKAIAAKVGSVMVSFSSVNGRKMHEHQHLLNGVLKTELGFQGFVVSDYNAVEALPGRYETQITSAINSGVDMVMAPTSYPRFIDTLERLVLERIPSWRIDDAVRRILAVKCEFDLIDWLPRHTSWATRVGSPEHRELAREAVQRSLVLLKNDPRVLPLDRAIPRVHVAGRNANDLGNQCGGWTINWQGSSGRITRGTTILDGIREIVGDPSRVTFSVDGSGVEGASAVIAVVGETPYAEMHGDVAMPALDATDQALLERVRRAGAPLILVIVSGRPLVLGPALERADAIVAAWLPGTEGAGVADVLFGKVPLAGKLGHSWPRTADQIPINVGDTPYDPLFPYGFGLSYPEPATDVPSAGTELPVPPGSATSP